MNKNSLHKWDEDTCLNCGIIKEIIFNSKSKTYKTKYYSSDGELINSKKCSNKIVMSGILLK